MQQQGNAFLTSSKVGLWFFSCFVEMCIAICFDVFCLLISLCFRALILGGGGWHGYWSTLVFGSINATIEVENSYPGYCPFKNVLMGNISTGRWGWGWGYPDTDLLPVITSLMYWTTPYSKSINLCKFSLDLMSLLYMSSFCYDELVYVHNVILRKKKNC